MRSTAAVAICCLALAGCGDDTAQPADDLQTQPSDAPAVPNDPGPAATAPPTDTTPTSAAAQRVDTPVFDAEGNEAGTLSVEPVDQGVQLTLYVENLEPGERAVHIHETGRCEPPFDSAGGHYGAPNAAHGMPDDDGPAGEQDHHWGDMPNQQVDREGVLNVQLINRSVVLSDSGPGALRDDDGSALVIHGGVDDYQSQPSGAAGERVACAVIAPPRRAG